MAPNSCSHRDLLRLLRVDSRRRQLDLDTITSRGGVRDDQEVDVLSRLNYELMGDSRGHFDTLAHCKRDSFAIHFNYGATAEDEEELAGSDMEMANLPASRRHALGDNGEIGPLYEVPTIADATPGVMFSRCTINWLHKGLTKCKWTKLRAKANAVREDGLFIAHPPPPVLPVNKSATSIVTVGRLRKRRTGEQFRGIQAEIAL